MTADPDGAWRAPMTRMRGVCFRLARSVYRGLPLPAGVKASLRDAYLSVFGVPRLAAGEESDSPGAVSPGSEHSAVRQVKSAYCRVAELELDSAVRAGRRLCFPTPARPRLTVLVVVYNAPALTYRCLESVSREADPSTEVVVVDNASGPQTQEVLDMLDGARVVRNQDNLHFLEAVNTVLPTLDGEYILLLNNDLYLLPGALERALRTLTENEAVGAVGAQVLGVEGHVLEAGCNILSKGECEGVARCENPLVDATAAPRQVDYVSGCFLMTPRPRLEEIGGFDSRYAPAYYEDVDYCTELWKRGWQVVCDPSAMVVHYESAGSSRYEVAELVLRNRQRFRRKHDWRAPHQARRATVAASSA